MNIRAFVEPPSIWFKYLTGWGAAAGRVQGAESTAAEGGTLLMLCPSFTECIGSLVLESRLLHKIVNLPFSVTNWNLKLTVLWGSWLPKMNQYILWDDIVSGLVQGAAPAAAEAGTLDAAASLEAERGETDAPGEPRIQWYQSLSALNTSPPRNRFTFLRSSCS